ncbi:LOW QUALITY PROTEIN: spermatogenesis-associated protein 32 [Choloepus didactylus]|uniref:LOW QUALITY PROTEIN: spermatogenesis-associated protein 32 n=1 Tax=Choloepus didactylus TaxID=27675 RepID=UPI00189DCD93|nr:LOW QUALITY PROTEIN: spermatogenesis-associated protein 32 [Choloepus didactylus]
MGPVGPVSPWSAEACGGGATGGGAPKPRAVGGVRKVSRRKRSNAPQHLPQPQRMQEEDEMEAREASVEEEVSSAWRWRWHGLQGRDWYQGGPQGQRPPAQLLPPRLSYETLQLEAELLEPKDNLDPNLDLDMKADLEMELEPKLEAKPDMTDEESYDEDSEQHRYTIEPVNPYVEELPASQDFGHQRSIRVQTSKHLFRADKLIQASEHSLQQVISMQQLQPSRPQASLPSLSSQPLPPSPFPSSSSLPPAIGLAELINFASALAMASSSKMDLPSLEGTIKAPSQKTLESPTKPTREPAAQSPVKEPRQEETITVLPWRPSEKPPEAGKTQNAWSQDGTGFAGSCLDFNKPGVKRATIEGEVKLLQPSAVAPPTQEARKDSVPGTKKGSPLLLQIHFKLSSPHPQRND